MIIEELRKRKGEVEKALVEMRRIHDTGAGLPNAMIGQARIEVGPFGWSIFMMHGIHRSHESETLTDYNYETSFDALRDWLRKHGVIE